MMQGGDRRHEVEGRRFEGMRQEVAQHKCSTSVIVVLNFGLVDAHLIKVDAHHFRHVPPKFANEHALTTTDVQSSPSTGGYRGIH